MADEANLYICTVPPAGWTCSRAAGHDGPCAARPQHGTEFSLPQTAAMLDQYAAELFPASEGGKVHFARVIMEAAATQIRFAAPERSKPVLQPWVASLTFMQQTVLLTAVRGPDGSPKYGPTKMLLRWYRRCILLSSLDSGAVLDNPYNLSGGSFMGPSLSPDMAGVVDWQAPMGEIVSQYLRELDALPHHFQLHFMHAAEIIGYKHPDLRIRMWWHGVYVRLVHDMHLWPETEEQLNHRLGDDRDQWLSRNDPATVS